MIYDVNGNSLYVANKIGESNQTVYFTVPVNQTFPDDEGISTNVQDSINNANVQCVLKLPPNYTVDGDPVPVIMCAHGTSGWVSANDYQAQFNRWDSFREDGYAIFDVNGGMPFDSANSYMAGQNVGGPRAVEAYYKAFQYIKTKYNVQDSLFVGGFSMGGLAALNLANRYPEIVRCIGLCYPVTALYNQAWLHPWRTGTGNGSTKSCIAREYNFASVSTWEENKTIGFNPENNKHIEINSNKYCFLSSPIKIWHGNADTTVDYTYSVSLINNIKNAGGVAEMRIVNGAGHGESSFSDWMTLFTTECKAFFDRYRQL